MSISNYSMSMTAHEEFAFLESDIDFWPQTPKLKPMRLSFEDVDD